MDMPLLAPASSPVHADAAADQGLVARSLGGDPAAFEALMRRYNPALFRVARAILRDEADAEDAVQEAYLSAWRHLGEFKGESRLSTWLTRIVINQALGRLRARKRDSVVVSLDDHGQGEQAPPADQAGPAPESPDGQLMRGQMRRLLERHIDALPLAFRTVFVMREVQEMSVDETAECLSIPTATVRTRVFRARSLLREGLAKELDLATGDVFGFAGARCDRIVARVLAGLPAAEPI